MNTTGPSNATTAASATLPATGTVTAVVAGIKVTGDYQRRQNAPAQDKEEAS